MASKFGILQQRLVGAVLFFIPDGSQIDVGPPIVNSDAETKPADLVDWEDFNIGTVNQSAYDPVTNTRTVQGFRYQARKYVQGDQAVVLADAFNVTLIEYPATLFDQLMYGLAAAPVDNTPQPIFANSVREVTGWVKILRFTEDKALLCDAEFRVKLTIQENPPDSFEPGSPVLRLQHLGDTDPDIETIVFNPTP